MKPKKNPKLTLLGTVHVDPQGPKRLERWLNRLQPDIVALETPLGFTAPDVPDDSAIWQRVNDMIAKLGLNLSKKQAKTIFSIEKITSAVRCYEYRISKQYCDCHQARLECVDIAPSVSQAALKQSQNDILGQAFQEPGVRSIFLAQLGNGPKFMLQQMKMMAEIAYSGSMSGMDVSKISEDKDINKILDDDSAPGQLFLKAGLNPERNEHMATRIRQLCEAQLGTVVFVGGIAHLGILAEKLKDLEPVTLMLDMK